MAYKKYIQKNGKLYGPYIYHSKRVDGKVVSEYRGMGNENSNYKTFLIIFAGIVLLTGLILFSILSNHRVTGNVVLGLDNSHYESGKPLDGILKFSLKEGELIPADSMVVFENAGKTYGFNLRYFISESPSEGNYYAYGKEINGNGEGYGVEGEKIVYPEVGFTLQIYNELTAGGEAQFNEINEIVSNGSSQDNIVNGNIAEENSPQTAPEENPPAPITGNAVRTSGGIFGSFLGLTGMVSLNLENEIGGVVSKDNPFVYDLKEGETAELEPNSVKIGNERVDDNIISLKIENGKAIVATDYSEIKKGYGEEYAGAKEKTFSFDLSNLNLMLEKGDLTIKLVYGDGELVQLTTLLVEGEEISNETIAEVNQTVQIKENIPVPISVNGTLQTNETPQANQTRETVNESVKLPVVIPEQSLNDSNKSFIEEKETVNEFTSSSIWNIADFLNSEERKALADNFGNISLKSSKSEFYNGYITRNYSFDKYSLNSSYSPSLSRELLEVEMEKDRVRFLKSIVKSIS